MQRRKDPKGRVLRDGESYRKSDGRYCYRWTDKMGKTHSIYARTLDELREKEEKILHDLSDGIKVGVQNVTLDDIARRWLKSKVGLKQTTMNNYKYMYNHYVMGSFGSIKIQQIKKSDVREFYLSLISGSTRKMALNTLERIHEVLHQVFDLAVEDEYIRKNPSDKVMGELKRALNYDTPKRYALTVVEQDAFMNYIKATPRFQHWLPLFTFFLGTGCRVSEIVGLRWEDVHMDMDGTGGYVEINHNMVYYAQERDMDTGKAKCYYAITTPKTKAGFRQIPLIAEVRQALLDEREFQQEVGITCNFTVDDYTDFVFLNRLGKAHNPSTINRTIKRITEAYNVDELERAEKERRKPILIPPFSCHNLRHTFCTRMWENGANAKVVQDIMGYADFSTAVDVCAEVTDRVSGPIGSAGVAQAIQSVMGHADYTTTMDIYTDVSMDTKERALSAMAGKIGL